MGSSIPLKKDARNLHALDPVAADDVPADLLAFRRKIGCGCILCMAGDTFPVSERAWVFPVCTV